MKNRIILVLLVLTLITPVYATDYLQIINTGTGFSPNLAQYARAQTFVLNDSGYITNVSVFYKSKAGTPQDLVQVRLTGVNGTKPMWANYYNQTFWNVSGLSTGEWHNINFDYAYVNASQNYSITLYDTDNSATNYVILGASNSDTYAKGSAGYNYYPTLNNSASWTMEANSDLQMKVYYSDTSPYVIEPTYFSFNASDSETTNQINSFSANITYNGSINNYSTTNGTINTLIEEGETINITVYAASYYPTTETGFTTNEYTLFNLTPVTYLEITTVDIETSNAINTFNATTIKNDDGTTENYTTITGGVTTTIEKYYAEIYNFTGESNYYVPLQHNLFNTSTDIQYNFTPYNVTQTINITSPYPVIIDVPEIISLNDYFDYATRYEIEVFYTVDAVNGTGTRLGNSTGVYAEDTTYYDISFNNLTVVVTGLNAVYNYSIRVFSYNINNEETTEQRFTLINEEDTDNILGFTFEVDDAKFWLFVIFTIGLFIISVTVTGYYIGYVATLYYLYYFIQFLRTDLPVVYAFVIIMMGVITFFVESLNSK